MSGLKDAAAFEDTFFTILKPCEGLFKKQNCKFSYFAFPVQSDGEIKANLAKLKKPISMPAIIDMPGYWVKMVTIFGLLPMENPIIPRVIRFSDKFDPTE